MSKISLRETLLRNPEGVDEKVDLLACSCGSVAFNVMIGDDGEHVGCVKCLEIYCQHEECHVNGNPDERTIN